MNQEVQNHEMNVSVFSDRVFAAAKAAGIDPAEICVSQSESFSVRVRGGKLEDYKVSDRFNLTLRGVCGGRIGTASTQALDEESVGMLIQGVEESAEVIETDEQDEILPPDEAYGAVCNYSEALREVSAQDHQTAGRGIRIVERTDDVRVVVLRQRNLLAQRHAGCGDVGDNVLTHDKVGKRAVEICDIKLFHEKTSRLKILLVSLYHGGRGIASGSVCFGKKNRQLPHSS